MQKFEPVIFKLLEEYCNSGVMPMHMPGHKRNVADVPFLSRLGGEFDITEIDGFDDLHYPRGILLDSMERAANLWRSKNSIFLVNGSTCGILAGIYSATKRGGKVVIARNCHMSVYNAVELCGLDPVFVMPRIDAGFGIYASLNPADIEAALDMNPDASLVVLTSPTYDGVISNVRSICEIAHARNIPVLVDEAHGAHLGFSPYFKGSAVEAGADIVIQSLHKTLPSLTQTAIAHINGSLVNVKKFRRNMTIFETSSPSYLLLAAIDGCVGLLESKGPELFKLWEENLHIFDEKISVLENLKVLMHGGDTLDKHPEIFEFDRSKILISSQKKTCSGIDLMKALRMDHNIELEMASGQYALAMTGLGDTKEGLKRFARALCRLDQTCNKRDSKPPFTPIPAIPKRRLSIADAVAADAEYVDAKKSEGRVSTEYVWAYPPGVPLIIPGEEINLDFLSTVRALQLNGVNLVSTTRMVPYRYRVVE